MKILTNNIRASFDYTILDTYQAGLQLLGNEVKSVKLGRASLKGAYITIKNDELFLINCNIPHYQNHIDTKYETDRPRKILLKRTEINSLITKKSASGLTIIPIKLYLNHGIIKLEIILAKGKKKIDKRHSIRDREEKRSIQRILRIK
ncbi:MAG: SsrA-binding protein SmpB [Minisyncoccia bacterium]